MLSLKIFSPVSKYKPVCNAAFSLPKGEQFVQISDVSTYDVLLK
jgi:hypothetical protein